MRCENCQTENPETAKFCVECARPFPRRCPSCGTSNPAAAKFCAECGVGLIAATGAASAAPAAREKPARERSLNEAEGQAFRVAAETSAPASDGERKTVTALFADIKGSTELMEDLDPEEARALVDPALQLMINAVRHYDGYIVQSTGDGIFALFGAPVAHEEHPQRALYAALRMQREIRDYAARLRAEGRPPIEIRVGINTGEVVVRSIRTGQHSTEYTPIGHTTNLASRLQTVAPTGSVVLSAATARLVAGYFELKSMGSVRIRGLSEAIVAHEVVGLGPLRTRLEASALRGFSKFVGRKAELDEMRSALDRAAEGNGSALAVTGEAGVGKSRLFHEFKAIVRPNATIIETFAVSHKRGSPWMPVLNLLNGYFGIVDGDNPRARREKITGKVMTLERGLEDTLPYLFGLFGIHEGPDPFAETDAQVKRRRSLEAVKRILLRESRDRPLVLIFEDLHWVDTSTQSLLDLIVQNLGHTRVLLLVNYRPEYRHGWGEMPCYAEINLRPLARESADEMLDAILGTGSTSLLRDLRQMIVQFTAGNPFFIEEIVRALFEQQILVRNGEVKLNRPLEEARIPPTVEGILAGRIDRLHPQSKELLQTLAVVGREFTLRLASRVAAPPVAPSDHDGAGHTGRVETLLGDLQAADFIQEEPALPDTRYTFKHALTQEVAYNSLLNERRKLLHERAAEAIEELFPDSLDSHLTDLAHHYGSSGNTDKAIEYLERAAMQASNRQAYTEAVDHLRAALKLLATLPENAGRDRREILLRSELGQNLIPLKSPAADEVRAEFERARELCLRHGEVQQLFWVVYALQFFYILRAEFTIAHELGERQLMIASRAGDPAMLAAACCGLAQTLLMMGEFGPTQELCERGLKVKSPSQGFIRSDVGDPRRMMLSLSSSALGILGYPLRALERSREALERSERFGGHSHALSLSNGALLRLRLREPNEALHLLDQLSALSNEHGFSMWAAQGEYLRAEALIQLDRIEEGVALLHTSVTAFEMTGGVGGLWRLTLAEAYGRMNRHAEGLELLETMREASLNSGLGIGMAELYRLEGELTLGLGPRHAKAAERHFEAAIELARKQQAKLFELRAAVSLARLLDASGRRDEARARLAPVYQWFTEGFEKADLVEARNLLDHLNA